MSKRYESLMRRLEDSDRSEFNHAVFLTYSIDIPFFEETILRALRRRGCGNIAVFADAPHVASAIREAFEHNRSSRVHFGREYSLTPVHHVSAFHPKVAILAGEEIEFWIGSGNLEPGGLVYNFEILNCILWSPSGQDEGIRAEERSLVSQCWTYLRDRVAKSASSLVQSQLEEVEEDFPWLGEAQHLAAGTRLVVSPDQDAVEEIARAVGNTKVERLILLSAFYDSKLAALKRMISKLSPKRVDIVVQEDTVSISGEQLKRIAGINLYRLRQAGKRYAHAKVFIAECKGRSVMLAGSHNMSEAALSGQHNYEVGLLQVSNSGTQFTEVLGLKDELVSDNLIPKEDAKFFLREQNEGMQGSTRDWIASAQFEDGVVEVLARKDIGESARLISYSLNGRESPSPAQPKIDQKKLLFEIGDAAAQWAAVAIRDNSETSAPVPLQHADVTTATTQRQKISRRLRKAAGAASLTEIAGVLDQFGILLFDLADLSTVTSRRMTGNKRLKPEGATDAKPMQLRPEDFVVEWSPRSHKLANRTSATTGLEDFFDALAALTGGRFKTRPESKQNDDTDRSLADEKIFDEEDFAEQREKGRDSSDSSGDLAVREQPPETTHFPPESRDEQLKAARRIAKRLSHFIERFCQHVENGLGDGPISVRLLETLTTAGRLVTTMVGRRSKDQWEPVELEDWDQWAEFHVGLLHLLSSGTIRLISRLPQDKLKLVTNAQRTSDLVAYLALVFALSETPTINFESRLRIQLGLLRVGRTFDVDQMRLPKAGLEGLVRELMGTMYKPAAAQAGIDAPQASHRALPNWINFVARFRAADVKFRTRFTGGAKEVFDTGAGMSQAVVGNWVWWPGGHGKDGNQGHVAASVIAENGKIGIISEPLDQPTFVIPSYVVAIPKITSSCCWRKK